MGLACSWWRCWALAIAARHPWGLPSNSLPHFKCDNYCHRAFCLSPVRRQSISSGVERIEEIQYITDLQQHHVICYPEHSIYLLCLTEQDAGSAHILLACQKRVSSTRRTGQENALVVYWAESELYRSIGQSCCWDMRFAQHHQRAAHLRVLYGTGTFSFYRPSKSSQGWAGWLQQQAREWNLHWKMQFDSKYFCKLKSNARHRFGQKKYRKEFETF